MQGTSESLEDKIRRAPAIYIANFGIGNKLWPDCLEYARLETFSHPSALPFLEAEDKEGYVRNAMEKELTSKGVRPDKSVAAKWYKASKTFETTSGDIWVHRADDYIWWTVSLPQAHEISYHDSHAPEAKPGDTVFHTRKPTLSWHNMDVKGRRLLWRGVHPKAHDFLTTESTMQRLGPEYEAYTRALILGKDLSSWHGTAKWKSAEQKSGKGLVLTASSLDVSVYNMAATAEATCNGSGQTVERLEKTKEFRFDSQVELREHVRALIAKQEGHCAISGLQLQYQGTHTDQALLCSLDRIDSNGHYEEGNLQVVCRFVNFWKSDQPDQEFRRLLAIVRCFA